MRLVRFPDHDAYVRAQRDSLRARGIGPYFVDQEMVRMAEWLKIHYKHPVLRGVCHGARNGLECDEFKIHFPLLNCFGTDLFPYSGKSAKWRGRSEVIEWDFTERREEWMGTFDFVYTNSLDHARHPEETLKVWMEQLKLGGVLFVVWSKGHVRAKRGDCFGALLYEYMDLMNSVGMLRDLLYVRNYPMVGNLLRKKRVALDRVVLVTMRGRADAEQDSEA